MTKPAQQPLRILSIDPSAKGFGYVVVERGTRLVDWGLKEARESKNARCIRQVAGLLKLFAPDLVILEDVTGRGSRRSPRVRSLIRAMVDLARERRVRVQRVKRAAVRRAFEPSGRVTKDAIAKLIAGLHPELAPRLPPPRKAWDAPDPRMAIFGAMALALVAAKGETHLNENEKARSAPGKAGAD